MPRHDWQYKTVNNVGWSDGTTATGYWVVCAHCGARNRIVRTEAQAKALIWQLKHGSGGSKLDKHFPPRGKFK